MKVDPEPFEDPAELDRTWGRQWGAWDEVGQLREVLVRPIGEELDQIDAAAWDPDLDGLVDPSGELVLAGKCSRPTSSWPNNSTTD